MQRAAEAGIITLLTVDNGVEILGGEDADFMPQGSSVKFSYNSAVSG